ncbi:hypothetical protein EC991_002421 [Linnemannia zychae]|nr:hypothetical protein EC991_002421 [Linnemannia zychae]
MRLLLPLTVILLSITAVITPGVNAVVEVESICHSNRRFTNAAAACVQDLIDNKKDVAGNIWCVCHTGGIFKRDVAAKLYDTVKGRPCRYAQVTDTRGGRLGQSTSFAAADCIGLDSIIPYWMIIPRPSRPEGGVLVTQFLLSESGEFSAVLQSDGNIIVKRKGQVFWYITDVPRSDGPFTAVLERDGKFCVRNRASDHVICTPSRGGSGDYKLQLGDDGNLCVRGPNPWCTGKYI